MGEMKDKNQDKPLEEDEGYRHDGMSTGFSL